MKIAAVIFLILFVWIAIPRVVRNEWIAPTPLPPGYWGLAYAGYNYEDSALDEPEQGYGWFRYDVWNNPPIEGRPVTRDDFSLTRSR